MNALVTFRLCKLSDEDLLKKVNEGIDNLYIEGKIPPRNIPARPDSDFDLLVGELIMRFKERDTTLTVTPIESEMIPRSVAFKIANRFYGSDYPLQLSQFENAAEELGYPSK